MKSILRQHILEALKQNNWQTQLSAEQINIKQNTSQEHGDFSSNIALQLAKPLSLTPRAIAESIAQKLETIDEFEKIEIAGAGFINVFLNKAQRYNVIQQILSQQQSYAQGKDNQQRVLVEFVSANPTGPLHVGHGRGAVYGDSLIRLLRKAGFTVDGEYYINDAGRQIDILTLSVCLRYTQKHTDLSPTLFSEIYPRNAYQGDYITRIADNISAQLSAKQKNLINNIDYIQFITDYKKEHDDPQTAQADKEHYIDQLITFVKHSFNKQDQKLLPLFKQTTLDDILQDIKSDLEEMGVNYRIWFSEQSLVDNDMVKQTLQKLKQLNQSYEKDGATWFKSTKFGDDKDRVLIRQDQLKTYLAHDISYHQDKYNRGYDHMINVWGADHHGYIARMKAAMTALGYDAQKLTICLVQFANLFRGEEKVAMSTRSGEFVSLRELREEVGNDATRFFYNLNRADQHLNFDLKLALEKSNDNPVFYVQYAYARIQSIFRRLNERGYQWQQDKADLSLLDGELELNLMQILSTYPQKIQDAAHKYTPHLITLYVRELATQIHQYYNQSTILVEEDELRNARLNLLSAAGMIIQDALGILGVNAPEKM